MNILTLPYLAAQTWQQRLDNTEQPCTQVQPSAHQRPLSMQRIKPLTATETCDNKAQLNTCQQQLNTCQQHLANAYFNSAALLPYALIGAYMVQQAMQEGLE